MARYAMTATATTPLAQVPGLPAGNGVNAIAANSLPGLRARFARSRALSQLQYQLLRIGPAGVIGVAGLVSALALAAGALWPAQRSLQSMRAELARPRPVHPASPAVDSLDRFVAALPTRGQIPAVLG